VSQDRAADDFRYLLSRGMSHIKHVETVDCRCGSSEFGVGPAALLRKEFKRVLIQMRVNNLVHPALLLCFVGQVFASEQTATCYPEQVKLTYPQLARTARVDGEVILTAHLEGGGRATVTSATGSSCFGRSIKDDAWLSDFRSDVYRPGRNNHDHVQTSESAKRLSGRSGCKSQSRKVRRDRLTFYFF